MKSENAINETLEDSKVFNACLETHVFFNALGGITIKQIDPMGNDDLMLCIPVDKVDAMIYALQKAKCDALGAV